MRKLILTLTVLPCLCFATPVTDETAKDVNKSLQELTKAINEHTKAIKNSILNNKQPKLNWNTN